MLLIFSSTYIEIVTGLKINKKETIELVLWSKILLFYIHAETVILSSYKYEQVVTCIFLGD